MIPSGYLTYPWKDPPFLRGKASINGPFSMAMLNKQRVYLTFSGKIHPLLRSVVNLSRFVQEARAFCRMCLRHADRLRLARARRLGEEITEALRFQSFMGFPLGVFTRKFRS